MEIGKIGLKKKDAYDRAKWREVVKAMVISTYMSHDA